MKVFLKFNRSDTHSIICLHQWMEIFKNYEITVVCDLYDVTRDTMPQYLSNLSSFYRFNVINTDYSTGNILPFKSRKRKQASANLTCFNVVNDEHFWIIDADDTMFLSRDYAVINDKLKKAEKIFKEENLDGFSLDFYRETHFDHWSFGVCILKSKIDLSNLSKVSVDDVDQSPGLTKNLDSYFDILRRKGIYNLKSFVLEDVPFQHVINPMDLPINGIYQWRNKKLYDLDLKQDIVIL